MPQLNSKLRELFVDRMKLIKLARRRAAEKNLIKLTSK